MKTTLLAIMIAVILMPSVSFAAERSTIEELQARLIMLLQEQVRLLQEKIILMEEINETTATGATGEAVATGEEGTAEGEDEAGPVPAVEEKSHLQRKLDYCREMQEKEPGKVHYYKPDQYTKAERCGVVAGG